jgi:hypothetical protein
MWDLALMTIFINHPLYVSFFSFSRYGTRVLQLHYVTSHDQLADIFTKSHPLRHFHDLFPNSSWSLVLHLEFEGAVRLYVM